MIVASFSGKDLENDHASSLSLKLFSNLGLLVNQFNNTTPENSNDHQKIYSYKYYDIEEMRNIEILTIINCSPILYKRMFS